MEFDVEVRGEGPDLLLLHSLLTDRESYALVAPRLSRSRRVSLLALPGFGRTPPAGPTVEDFADSVARYVETLPTPPDVIGNGFGGFIALALAARHGAKIRKLVLADTGACFPESGRAPFRGMAEAVEKNGMEAIVQTAVRRIFPEPYLAAHPEALAQRREVLLKANPRNFASACRALATLDLRPALAGIKNPTLVMVGTLDAATPPALAREVAAGIPGAKLVEIQDCGHCPPLERPDDFLAAVEPFLAG
ncbi:MAG TPA: alpha/beta fold hydrolase [Myxococcales bacterium]|jgi:3-oxoadipate enol-lactonase